MCFSPSDVHVVYCTPRRVRQWVRHSLFRDLLRNDSRTMGRQCRRMWHATASTPSEPYHELCFGSHGGHVYQFMWELGTPTWKRDQNYVNGAIAQALVIPYSYSSSHQHLDVFRCHFSLSLVYEATRPSPTSTTGRSDVVYSHFRKRHDHSLSP
jgi:hypothetical protein